MPQFYPVNTERVSIHITRRILMVVSFAACFSAAFAQPSIDSVWPAVGPGKMQLMIKGHNFSPYAGHNLVNFGATQGLVLFSGADTLRVIAPYTGDYQPITVESDGLTAVGRQSYDQTFSNGGMAFSAASFAPPVNYAVDGNALSVSDLNLDGKPEIISGSGSVAASPQFGMRSFSVLNNTGGGGTLSFSTQHFSTLRNPYIYIPVDLDGDGRPDLVSWDTASNGTNEITVYPNNTFSPTVAFNPGVSFAYGPQVYSAQPVYLEMKDFDGDGLLDILTV